jgi:putative heme-binding domain-containing protein
LPLLTWGQTLSVFLISDILDPNRMVEARWSAYQVELSDGRTMVGLIASETADAVVVALPGGARETIARGTLRELKSLDRSLMPLGLEAAISIEQMAHLIAFLTGR